MMFKILNGREHFWQWDTGQKLIVDGDICSEVHFCNGTSDCSLICEVHDGTVDVPNILLQEAKFIKAYAYVCGEDDQHTERVQMFLVMPRTKPDDYVYTETEVKRYETLERRLDDMEEKGISEDKIAAAVEAYLKKNIVGGLPPGGTAGQILTKKSEADGDVEWADLTIPKEYGLVTYNQNKTIIVS